ncbi:hypothetical protein T261_06197 [Streptomyces lydicus]|nr:hypothetical protein T261_06197 [Streptomyces lydicus]
MAGSLNISRPERPDRDPRLLPWSGRPPEVPYAYTGFGHTYA